MKEPIISDRARTIAYSVMPFINVPGREEVVKQLAIGIQRAMETYWPEMKKERDDAIQSLIKTKTKS